MSLLLIETVIETFLKMEKIEKKQNAIRKIHITTLKILMK